MGSAAPAPGPSPQRSAQRLNPLPGWVAFSLLFCLPQGPAMPEELDRGRGAPPGGPGEVKGERRRGKEMLESAGGRGRLTQRPGSHTSGLSLASPVPESPRGPALTRAKPESRPRNLTSPLPAQPESPHFSDSQTETSGHRAWSCSSPHAVTQPPHCLAGGQWPSLGVWLCSAPLPGRGAPPTGLHAGHSMAGAAPPAAGPGACPSGNPIGHGHSSCVTSPCPARNLCCCCWACQQPEPAVWLGFLMAPLAWPCADCWGHGGGGGGSLACPVPPLGMWS